MQGCCALPGLVVVATLAVLASGSEVSILDESEARGKEGMSSDLQVELEKVIHHALPIFHRCSSFRRMVARDVCEYFQRK